MQHDPAVIPAPRFRLRVGVTAATVVLAAVGLGVSPAATGADVGIAVALDDVVEVSVGSEHACALLTDATLQCWGYNSTGQLGDNTTTVRNQPVTVLDETGSGPLTDVAHVYAGWSHTCAVLLDGTARCWGWNANGQLGDGTTTQRTLPVEVLNAAGTATMTNVIELDLSTSNSCARLAALTARCWGDNFYGQLGDGTTTDHILPVRVLTTSGLATMTNVVEITAGPARACARVAALTARCWGDSGAGALGDGTTTDSSLAVRFLTASGAATMTNVQGVSTGTVQTCVFLTDQTARCTGANNVGQLGNGTLVDSTLPVTVSI